MSIKYELYWQSYCINSTNITESFTLMNNAIYCRWSRIRCTSSCSYRIDNIHYEQWQTLIFTISHNYSMCIIQKREIKIKTSHLAHSSMGGEKQSKLTSSTNLNLLHLTFLLCILFYQNEIIRWTASLPRSLIILVTTDNVMIQCRGACSTLPINESRRILCIITRHCK